MKPSPAAHQGKKALVYFHCFHKTLGGSEYLPVLFIAELQKREYAVTLALGYASELNLEQAAKLYHLDVNIDMRTLDIVFIYPKTPLLKKLDLILPFYRSLQLKKLAKHADICISTANMFDFGKPAHHVVYLLSRFNDNAFTDFYLHRKPLSGFPLFKRKLRTFLAESFLRPIIGVRSTRKIIADQREHIYVPSKYTADIIRAFYGPFDTTVFYPPTAFRISSSNVERDPLRVIYLGRIKQQKGILEIIDIVKRSRTLSNRDIKLHLAGPQDPGSYLEKLKRAASDNPWIQMVGPIYGQDKTNFLLGGTYAIHAERDEAFGIAITEYLKAGCIPIVPDEGGTPEIVDNPALTYHTNEDAAQILARLLSDESFRQEQLAHCKKRAERFSFEHYMETQHKILDTILESPA